MFDGLEKFIWWLLGTIAFVSFAIGFALATWLPKFL